MRQISPYYRQENYNTNILPIGKPVCCFDPKIGVEKIIERLKFVFKERGENLLSGVNSSGDVKVEKTVFIKAPRPLDYGSVVKVIDAVKIAGASPISLQIDDLN